MPLMDCDAPAVPTPTYTATDLYDRLSFLRLNLWRYNIVSVAGGAAIVNPLASFGEQLRGWTMPGGSATPRVQVLGKVAGLATTDGAAYALSFMASVDSGTATLRARWRDSTSGAITGLSDQSWTITTTPTTFEWEGIASDDPEFNDPVPNNSYFEFFVSGTTDIPAGRTLTITNLQIQTDNYWDQAGVTLPWRPARGEPDLAIYGELILGLNRSEMALKPNAKVSVGPEGGGLVLNPNGPVKFVTEPTTARTITAADDGVLITFTHVDGCTVTFPANADAAVVTKSETILVRGVGAGPVAGVAGAGATLDGPSGCVFTLTGEYGAAVVRKQTLNGWIWQETVGNPITVGAITFESGDGVPTRTDRAIGSYFARKDVAQLWRYVGTVATGTGMGLGSYTVDMTKIPTEGNFLVAVAFGFAGQGAPNTGDGWTDIPTADHVASGFAPSIRAAYLLCGSGESLSQTPFTGGSGARALVIWEVAGLDPTWTPTFDATTWDHNTSGGVSGSLTRTTTNDNTLCLFAGDFYRGGSDPGVPTLLSGFTVDGTAQAVTVDGGQSLIAGHKVFPTSGTSASETMFTAGAGGGVSVVMLSLSPGGTVVIGDDVDAGAGWRKMSDFTSILNEGVEVEANPISMDFVGAAVDVESDGEGSVTVTLHTDTDGTLSANSDEKIATQKAVRTAINAAIAGLSWKQKVRAATTTNGTLASAFENGDTIDGVTLATGDRILIKNQSSGAENGIYTVNASGAPTRATDADSGAELVNATVYVSEGTTLADTQWTCTTNATITVGSTSLAFAQSGAGGGSGTVTNTGTLTAGRLIVGNGSADVTVGLTDVTTDNVSTSAHGLVPKAPNDTAKFLRGDGAWASTATIAGAAPYVYTNPPFANVSALLHFDGTNGSTTITNQVTGTWTAVGSAAISTAQSVFGGASLLVPSGSNSSVKTPTSSAFDVATGDWSIEFRWRYNGAPQTAARVFATRDGDTNQGIGITIDANSAMSLNMSSTGSSPDMLNAVVASLSQTGWNSVIIQRRGVFVETFVNGTLIQPFTVGSRSIYYNSGDTVIIGGNATGTSRSMNAYIDDFRFTKGSYVMVPGDPGLPTSALPNS